MPVGDQYGIIRVRSNAELSAEEEAAAMEAEQDNREAVITELAAHCRTEWQRARDAKQPLEIEMLNALRQREGRYSDTKLNAIREMGGSEIKMMLTDVKCRAAEAWIKDIMQGSGERPFSIKPTPIPDIPQEVREAIGREAYMEMEAIVQGIPHPRDVRERIEAYEDEVLKHARRVANRQAQRMEDKIDDEYIQGKFYEALDDFVWDFTTLKAGIIKGPVIHRVKSLQWANETDPVRMGGMRPVVTDTMRRMFYAPSPFDIYLTPEARNFQEGSLIERHRLAPDMIYGLIGAPGYNEQAIRDVIEQYGDDGLRDWLWYDMERNRLESRPYDGIYDSGNLIDTLEVWTKVRGQMLLDWGMPENEIPDPHAYYNANVWIIGTHVIRATLNDDPLGMRPYHESAYVKVRNSPWGRGVPEIMSDLQDMCDSTARALSNNMGIASGPQAEIFVDRLPEGEDISKMYPWKIWQTVSNKFGTPGPAVNFFQPNTHADVLMAVFRFFSSLADEYTGIPAYQYGDPNVGGAGRTASGLSMLMNASGRTMKGVIKNIDGAIIKLTQRMHRDVMMNDTDLPYKGDIIVVAKASQALLHRETQQLRINETLQSTMNPIDFQIMGPRGRLELLRGALRGIDAVDVEKVLPSNDMALMQAMAQQLPPPQQQGEGEENGPPADETVRGMTA